MRPQEHNRSVGDPEDGYSYEDILPALPAASIDNFYNLKPYDYRAPKDFVRSLYKRPPADQMPYYSNRQILEQCAALQQTMPQGVLFVPCQWDKTFDTASLNDATPVGQNIAYRLFSEDTDTLHNHINFLMVFSKDKLDYRLQDVLPLLKQHAKHCGMTDQSITKDIHSNWVTFAESKQQSVYLHHYISDNGIVIPATCAMDSRFAAHSDKLGTALGRLIEPKSRLSAFYQNLKQAVGLADPNTAIHNLPHYPQ